jgi:hypothetical protein
MSALGGVPKTSSAFDRLKESPNVSAHNVCTALLRLGRIGLAIQVEEPA